MANDHKDTASWLVPEGEQQGLRRYLGTVRERFALIALTVVATTAVAALYVVLAEERYEARANLLVTPISRDNETLTGLGLIRDSADPTRDVETAAQLVMTLDVARMARRELGRERSAESLLGDVEAVPVAQSNIVAVTATAPGAKEAQRIANAFGRGVVKDRTRKLHRQLDEIIAGLRQRLAGGAGGGNEQVLRNRLAEFETLRVVDDPTIHLDTRADEPDNASWPRPRLSIAAGIVVGLMLGLGGAFAAQMLDPRLRREDQLRARFRLPVLARVPVEGGAPRKRPIGPERLSSAGVEAFRALRAALTGRGPGGRHGEGPGGGRSVMICGSSSGEGKTTVALNLAASLALSGRRVILIEADSREPRMAEALGVRVVDSIASVLIGDVALTDALVTTEAHGEHLRVLLARSDDEWMADQLSLPVARELIEEATQLADFVVIDAPPLDTVVDALPLVQAADDVIVVARLGTTRLDRLERLGELLADHGVKPLGLAVVGTETARRRGRGATARPDRSRDPEPVLPAR